MAFFATVEICCCFLLFTIHAIGVERKTFLGLSGGGEAPTEYLVVIVMLLRLPCRFSWQVLMDWQHRDELCVRSNYAFVLLQKT